MPKTDPKIDAYIAKSQDFAKPILEHFRDLVHKTCPEAEEKIKWSFPHFDYKGEMMCAIAAFKQHCSIGFWKASIMPDPHKILIEERGQGMGHLGKITHLNEMPSDKILTSYIKEAMKLNDAGIKINKSKPLETRELILSEYLIAALKKNKKAQIAFEAFSTSNKREYTDWLMEAKTEATRLKRLETALEWIAEGKIRNWKYLKK